MQIMTTMRHQYIHTTRHKTKQNDQAKLWGRYGGSGTPIYCP